MATGNVTTTTIDAFIPEVWSKEIILASVNQAVFAPLVRRDFDGDIQEAGDVVHIPLFSAVTIGDKSGNTAVTYTNYTESVKDITINKHKYFAFRVEDIARVQSSPDLIEGYSRQGARGLASTQDTDVAALTTSFTQSVENQATDTTAYGDITDVMIRRAAQYLDDAGAPDADRYLVISPAQKNAMLGISKFVEASTVGDANQAITKGFFGQIYGLNVYVSNNLPDTASASASSLGFTSCAVFHREAIGLAVQSVPRVQAAYDINHLATSVVGDVLYGTAILVPTFGVELRVTNEG